MSAFEVRCSDLLNFVVAAACSLLVFVSPLALGILPRPGEIVRELMFSYSYMNTQAYAYIVLPRTLAEVLRAAIDGSNAQRCSFVVG